MNIYTERRFMRREEPAGFYIRWEAFNDNVNNIRILNEIG